ncbi:hypothetical protein, partial [Lysinibacillus boronitolerans]|uniref:hypothetical protein n=1 Tax=Lysinibacillus boronitolerans TaxID=309788 RepID=UPI002896D292
MATYRWKKYVIEFDSTKWTVNQTNTHNFLGGWYKNIAWNGTSWITSGVQWINNEAISAGGVGYAISGLIIYRLVAQVNGTVGQSMAVAQLSASTSTLPKKSTYIGEVTSTSQTTFPTNGAHSDGYWYDYVGIDNTAPTMPGAFTQPSGNLEI